MTFAQRGSGLLLRLFGWRRVFVPPPVPKGIVVVYPHTSNWDFIIGILYKIATGFQVRWVGKDTLFRWPVRRLLLRLGGIPVNRRDPSGFVDTLLAEFARAESLWLGMAPEGTRAHTDHWKSGFYRIALAGGLCVGLGYIDYATRTVGLETYVNLTGDPTQDLARIRAFYAGKRGRLPENEGDIRLHH
ncbi:MAG TPA: 1-acyl-sn-glycerol-3-phosphate acyltransferase [Steroidobacteraceae bacterium]|nr:1-acyl-sn-glycerol-3-phosphate acyltransferase [Steroidobacteraceae bacterium]